MQIILIYLAGINLCGFLVFGIDKLKAKRNAWRVPEATLFSFALLGGGIGCLGGMYLFRHKIRKSYFVIGIPAIIIAQILAAAVIIFLSPISISIQ